MFLGRFSAGFQNGFCRFIRASVALESSRDSAAIRMAAEIL
jgi:hypothetical protein